MEASPTESAEGLSIVRVLAAVLDRLVSANAPVAHADPGQITKFHAMKAPGIAIEQYLERIHKYASCSKECFILALIYIDRLIQRTNFLLTELNVHRVVITAVLLAAKFFDDAYYNNAYYAKVGGVLISEMNGLEVDFLFRINFSLHVTPEEFEKYRMELLSHAPVSVVAPLQQPQAPKFVQMQAEAFQQQQQQQPIMTSHVQRRHTLVSQNVSSTIGSGDVIDHHDHSDAVRAASQITPSPPAGAGRTETHVHHHDSMVGQIPSYSSEQMDEVSFFPVERANSLPIIMKSSSVANSNVSYFNNTKHTHHHHALSGGLNVGAATTTTPGGQLSHHHHANVNLHFNYLAAAAAAAGQDYNSMTGMDATTSLPMHVFGDFMRPATAVTESSATRSAYDSSNAVGMLSSSQLRQMQLTGVGL